MLKHCIVHIHCLDHPSVYKIVKSLSNNISIFTGCKIATITKVSTELDIYNNVLSILSKLGFEVIEVQNNELRETGHFFEVSLPKLLSKYKTGLLYYCHSKGVSYHPDSEDGRATSIWTDVLIDNTLNKHYSLPFDNLKYATFGSCIVRDANFLPDDIGEQFSFIGTFFWVRIEKLEGKLFKPHSKFYLEALPGLVCTLLEAFNQGPEFKSGEAPYSLSSWEARGIYNGFLL